MENILGICGFLLLGHSLTRGRVCNLPIQLLHCHASALPLKSRYRGTPDHILLSHLHSVLIDSAFLSHLDTDRIENISQ
jgi:hypothetical protein